MDSLFQTLATFVIALSVLLFFGPIIVLISIIGYVDLGHGRKLDLKDKKPATRFLIASVGLGSWLLLYVPLVLLAFRFVVSPPPTPTPTSTLTATPTPANTPTVTPTSTPTPEMVALITYHNKFVTATSAGRGWVLQADAERISDCERFTLLRQDDGRVAFRTCHGRYVTAPNAQQGPQWNWLLRAEPELSDCGKFSQVPLGGDRFTFVTCDDRYVTAMDDIDDITYVVWNWMLRAETAELYDWEKFTLVRLQE